MSTGRLVVIAGREFAFGAAYRPREPGPQRPRRLLGHTADSLLPGGRVTAATVPAGKRRTMTGEAWAAWAGEEVET
jgi:hypothetical protein